MSQDIRGSTSNERQHITVLHHARTIEDRKRTQNRITDLIIEAFDLPQNPSADPAHPEPSDAHLFRQCLKLFQPSDFDDLVYERNVDNRCGYALCPRPNLKVASGEIVWNGKTGKDFKLVPKEDLEKWCSKECGERALFVKGQLGQEPAWLRETPVEDIRFLDEVQELRGVRHPQSSATIDIVDSMQSLTLESDSTRAATDDISERMHALALERGDFPTDDLPLQVSIIEKSGGSSQSKPPTLHWDHEGLVEGHRPRRVHFAEGSVDDEDVGT